MSTTTRSTASKPASLDEGEDRYSIERSSEADTKDTQEVLNYEQAVEDGIEMLDSGGEISISLLHELHETLLTDVPDDRVDTDTIGAYKAVPNHLGDFLPPVPGEVDGLMDALLTSSSP